jgi:phosphatidylserine decarboxylase
MIQSAADRLFVALQRLLPGRALARLVHRLARTRRPAVKDFLIAAYARWYGVDTAEALHPVPDGYEHLNAFFTRELKPGARPLDSRPGAFLCPADGTLEDIGTARGDRLLQAKRHEYRLADLLASDAAGCAPFLDGGTATIYLAPRDYHRVHMPFGGRVRELVHVPGDCYAVNQRTARAVPGLFARNERVICWCESPAGRFAVVLVGAMNVRSISMTWTGEVLPSPIGIQRWIYGPDDPRVQFSAGSWLGQFNLGSTVVLVTERGMVDWLPELSPGDTVRMGRCLGIVGGP